MRENKKIIALYGGTFDPIHNGHLDIAQHILTEVGCDRINFIPCKKTLLKASSTATVKQRLEMLTLALKPYPKFHCDTREIDRETPSYTLLTVESFKKEFPDVIFCLVVGEDVLSELHDWYHWKNLLDYCHLIIAPRPKVLPLNNSDVRTMLEEKKVCEVSVLHENDHGFIYFLSALNIDIASRDIREKIARGEFPASELPLKIINYIKENKLYT